MPIDLTKPLRWTSANVEETAMLADMQGNILKGHGRRATRHLFLEFAADQTRARAFVRDLSHFLTSAKAQLNQAQAFKATGQSGGPFVAFVLTAAGYAALGAQALAPAAGAAGAIFAEGMRRRGAALNDPAVLDLEPDYRGAIHAMVLLAGDPDDESSWTSTSVDDLETKLLNLMSQAARVVASEAGRAIFNANGDGLEHFGYVDGRSQPLLLAEDIDHEQGAMGGIDQWDPTFPIGQVLVKDPGSPLPTAFGSYFVFRKLEQNVNGFKAAEEKLGQDLKNGELAGAAVVGRWEDGTPVVLSDSDGQNHPITNNFNYDGDPDGAKCPIHAHIRKTNPRGETTTLGGAVAQERAHIMARRGITYGRRTSIVDPQDAPDSGVGLLFMAYQKDLGLQFEFTQASWANNEHFLRPDTGRDPVIGQGGASVLHHNRKWGDPASGKLDEAFGGFVTLKGGEYFFAPAISTLASL